MTDNQSQELIGESQTSRGVWHKDVFRFAIILGAQYVLAFVTSPLIARILGPTDRGRLTFFFTIPQWAIVVLGFGAPQALTYLVASRRFSKSQSLSVVFTVLVTLAGLILILTLVFVWFWSPALSRLSRTEVILLPLLSFASIALVMLLAVLLGLQRTFDYYLFQLLTPVLFFGSLVGLFVTGRFVYLSVAESYTAVMIVSCVVIAYWLIRQLGFSLNLSLNFWRPILGYGLKIYIGSILSLVIVRMDVFFVAAFLGFTALGYYAIAVQLAEVVYRMAGIFATIRLPETASGSKADADQTFPAVSRQLILLSIVGVSIVALGGSAFIGICLPAFGPSIPALLLLLPGSAFLGLANLYFAELGGRGRAGYGSTIITINSITMIVLDYLIIPVWGINGAALVSTIVYAMGFVFAVYALHRESSIRFLDLVIVRRQDFLVYKALIRRA